MAAKQPPNAELIAIYRLEFYKKQKNWKLSTHAKKGKELQTSHSTAPVKVSKILNETYSIESNIKNNASVLNDAFLKDESDKETPVSPRAQTSLSTQWLEPINACEECHRANQKPQNPWADYVDDGWAGAPDLAGKCSGDGNECEGFDGRGEGMVWANSGFPQVGWTGDVAASMNIQDPDSRDIAAWPADTMSYNHLDQLGQLNPCFDDQMWIPHIWYEDELMGGTLESIDEFMIGAHSAPHSSEVDLCMSDYDGEDANIEEGTLSRMSGAALAAAVRRQSGSLRRLLREAGQRRKYRSTFSLDICTQDQYRLTPRSFFSTDYSYEAFPTRDVPFNPNCPIYPRNDLGMLISPTDQYKEGFVPLSKHQYKDGFTSLPLTNTSKDRYSLLPSTDVHMNGSTQFQPASQCRDTSSVASPSNIYRDGFLAGSYRNKVPLKLVGRGRGRLREDRGVEA